MSEVIPVFNEIEAAHRASLEALEELAKNREYRPLVAALRRWVETWELRLLTSRVGAEITPSTLAELNGAFAIMSDIKSLFEAMLTERPKVPARGPMTDKLFAETLLGNPGKPSL